nr:hypothetical protein [Tanacetum cinerariifolium]
LLPQIRAEIREEFRTSSEPSDVGGSPPPATAPVDVENWISHMQKIFDVMGCEDAFKTRLDAENWISHMEKIISCACHIQMWLRLPMLLATMRSFMRGMMRTMSDQTSGRGVVIGIRGVVTGATVIITTVMDLTGEVVVTTTAAATTTTLAVTTGIPVMGMTIETGIISPTDLPILVLSSPGVPLRATPIQFALLVDVDTQESVVEL